MAQYSNKGTSNKTYAKKGSKKTKSNKGKFQMSNRAKSIITTVLMIALIFGLLVGVNALFNKKPVEEGYDLQKVTWKKGAINADDGSMMIDEGFMYSSVIPVDESLLIRTDFESHISYKIYYYDDEGNVVYKDVKPADKETEGYITDYKINIADIPVEEGVVIDHARIEVQWLEDDNDRLSYFERFKLSRAINVFVNTVTNEVETEE